MADKPWDRYQGSGTPGAGAGGAPKPWEKFSPAVVASPQASAAGEAVGAAVRGVPWEKYRDTSIGAGIGSRAAELAANTLEGGQRLATALPDMALAAAGQPAPQGGIADPVIDYFRRRQQDIAYQSRVPWETVKEDPSLSNIGRFLLEQGLTSAPDMLMAGTALPAYAVGLGEEIGRARAENDGRAVATDDDFGYGMMAGLPAAFLERLGLMGMIAPGTAKTVAGRIGQAAGREAATEAGQEGIQYTGETVGTQAGFDPATGLERSAVGALVGGPLGGTVRGAVEGLGALAGAEMGPQQPPAAPGVVPPAGRASPPPPVPPAPPAAAAAPAADQQAATGIQIGQMVGLKMPNARGGVTILNATPERVEGGVVYWRDEDGNVNADAAADFARDMTQPVAPKAPPTPTPPPSTLDVPLPEADPLAGATPAPEPPPRRVPPAPLLGESEGAPAPVRRRAQPVDIEGEEISRLRMVADARIGMTARAEEAVAAGHPGARSAEELAVMQQERDRASAALNAALLARQQRQQQATTETDAAMERTRQANAVAAEQQRQAAAAQAEPVLRPQAAVPVDTFIGWLRRRGGIGDPDGELKARGLTRIPALVRRMPDRVTGALLGSRRGERSYLDPDIVREAAVEDGWLPEGADLNDLYDAIDRAAAMGARGPVPVRAGDVDAALQAAETVRARQEQARYEDIYGVGPLGEARYQAEQVGAGWEPDQSLEDIRAAIDERLAMMDVATAEEAMDILEEAERAEGGTDASADTIDVTEDFTRDPLADDALADRAPADAQRQADGAPEEEVVERSDERAAEGAADAGTGPAPEGDRPAGGGRQESRRGSGEGRPPSGSDAGVERGPAAIGAAVRREAEEGRLHAERATAEGRPARGLTAEDEAEIGAFTDFLGEHLLSGVGLKIVRGEGGEADGLLADYQPETGIVTLFREAIERGLFNRAMVHELWHAVEPALTPEARQTVIGEWRKGARQYAARNPWADAFVAKNAAGEMVWLRDRLTPDESRSFLETREGRKALREGRVDYRTNPDGTSQVWLRWTDENYRFRSPSEFFAEVMGERYAAMRESLSPEARSVFEWLRALWDRFVEGLRRAFRGPDAMAGIFDGFQQQAMVLPENPLPPLYQEVLAGTEYFAPRDGPQPTAEGLRQELRRQTAMPPVSSAAPVFRLHRLMSMFKTATYLARRDPRFAPLFQAQLDEHYLETRLIRDGGDAMRKLLDLSTEQRAMANRIFEYARLSGTRIQPTGRRIVLQVGNTTPAPALSAQGDVLMADAETTAAIHDAISWLGERWYGIWGSRAAAAGYRGDFTYPGIAQAKADAVARKDRGAESLADFAKELLDAATAGERDGYIPFMRYGDTAIIVRPKVPPGGQGPAPVEVMALVDTTAPLIGVQGMSRALARKRREMEAKYPPGTYDYEVKRLGERDIDALDLPLMDKLMVAAGLDKPAAAVKIYQQLLNLGTSTEKDMFKQIARALPQAARRQIIEQIKSGLLKRSRNVQGYETDFIGRSLLDYNRATAGIIAKSMLRDRVEAGKERVFGNREKGIEAAHSSVVDWSKKWLDYIEGPESSIWRMGRFLGFYMNLFGSISSALVNAFSTATVTIPQSVAWSNSGPIDVMFATGKGLRGIAFNKKRGFHINPRKLGLGGQILADVLRAEQEGLLSPSLAADLYGKEEARFDLARKGSGALQAYLEVGASFFNYAEQANRYIAYIAAWRSASKPRNLARFRETYKDNARVQEMIRTGGLSPDTVARFVVENTQFIGGQIDRPGILRGPGGVILQFKTYALNYVRLLRENLQSQGARGKMAALAMIGTMMLFGGMMAVPGVEDMMVLVESIYNQFGEGGLDVEAELRDLIYAATGDVVATEAMVKGFSRQALGVDLSSRIGIGRLTPEFSDPLLAIPLLAATVGRFQEATKRYNRGENVGGTVALLSPIVGKGIADVARGFLVLDQEGYVTRTGTQKFAPHEITFGEKLMQSMGLRPARFARTLEYDYAQRRIATQMNGPRADLMDRLQNLGYNAYRARESGDEEAALAFEAELLEIYDDAWEEFMDPSTAPERLVKPPDWSDINRGINDRIDELSRIKRAPKLARDAMLDIPYMRE